MVLVVALDDLDWLSFHIRHVEEVVEIKVVDCAFFSTAETLIVVGIHGERYDRRTHGEVLSSVSILRLARWTQRVSGEHTS